MVRQAGVGKVVNGGVVMVRQAGVGKVVNSVTVAL